MTPVTHSLVFSKVSIVYTSILILQTPELAPLTSITLLVIRVLHLMTQVCSIAHTFLSRWFVQLARTPSSQKLASRRATAWLLTPSHRAMHKVLAHSPLTLTATTEEFALRTSCDSYSQELSRGSSDPLFLC